MALNNKQKLFLDEYIKNNYTNATHAYQRIYPDASNPSARASSSKILKMPEAIEYIEQAQKEAYKQASITAERIALHLAKIAFDNGELYAKTPQIKALDLLQKQLGLQTQKVDANVNQEQVIEVKIED